MDHYQNPRNEGLKEGDDYATVYLKNPSCGDSLAVQVKLAEDGEHLEEIRQMGVGCSICCTSASMMSELLTAHTLDEAAAIIQNFKAMVTAEPYDEELLGEAVALQGVSRLQPRVKCATLGWEGIEEAIAKARSRAGAGAAGADGDKVATLDDTTDNGATPADAATDTTVQGKEDEA